MRENRDISLESRVYFVLGGLSPNIQVQATLNMILMEYNIFYIEVMLRLSYKDLKEIYGIQRY
jgi:hypothetical protein